MKHYLNHRSTSHPSNQDMAELMHDLHGQPRKAYERSDQHRLLKPVHVVRDLTIPFPFARPSSEV